jgi:hypothetical protein
MGTFVVWSAESDNDMLHMWSCCYFGQSEHGIKMTAPLEFYIKDKHNVFL